VEVRVNGAANFATSSGALGGGQQVNRALTTLTALPSLTNLSLGQLLTVSATVTANAPSTGVPTGAVRFFDTDTAHVLQQVPLNTSGVASLSITDLAVGTHIILATYDGTANFAAASNATPSITVCAPLITVL